MTPPPPNTHTWRAGGRGGSVTSCAILKSMRLTPVRGPWTLFLPPPPGPTLSTQGGQKLSHLLDCPWYGGRPAGRALPVDCQASSCHWRENQGWLGRLKSPQRWLLEGVFCFSEFPALSDPHLGLFFLWACWSSAFRLESCLRKGGEFGSFACC